MNPLWYILFWYLIGLATFALMGYLDYKNGQDLTLKKLFQYLAASVFGLFVVIVFVVIVVSCWLAELDFNKVLIKGKKKY